jgi:hypothetical protein
MDRTLRTFDSVHRYIANHERIDIHALLMCGPVLGGASYSMMDPILRRIERLRSDSASGSREVWSCKGHRSKYSWEYRGR